MDNQKIHCINFGLCSRTLTVGFTGGVRVFLLGGIASLDLVYDSRDGTPVYSDVRLAESVDSTLALIQSHVPKHLVLYDFVAKKEINKIKLNEEIVSFNINKAHMIIRLSHSVVIFDQKTHCELNVQGNADPHCPTLSVSSTHSPTLFAYHCLPHFGSVSVCSFSNDLKFESLSILSVPNVTVDQVQIDSTGDLVALTSSDATTIFVFRAYTGQIVYQFCRGLSRHVAITSLFFSEDKYLICSSDYDTAHVFELIPQSGSLIGGYISKALSYLPFGTSFMMQRSSIRAKIPTRGYATRSYYWEHGGMSWLAVASYCGKLHVFVLDIPNKQCILISGDCNLLKVEGHVKIFTKNDI